MNTRILLAALAAFISLPTLAQTATPGIDRTEVRQQQRIDQGVRSGQLTPQDAARLEKGQAHVDRMVTHAKADGVVTRHERQRIRHVQHVQSHRIHHARHHIHHHDKADRPLAK
jgi:uncharacterized membrane protein YebE (DUF533 family)